MKIGTILEIETRFEETEEDFDKLLERFDDSFEKNEKKEPEWVEATHIQFESVEEIESFVELLKKLKEEAIAVREDWKQAQKKYEEQCKNGFTGVGVAGYLRRGVHFAVVETKKFGGYMTIEVDHREESDRELNRKMQQKLQNIEFK